MALWPVRFSDANFERQFAWCRSPLEGRSLRWIPFGMPRLNPVFQNAVFFLFGRDENTGELREQPEGTGVLVGYPQSRGLPYNRHIYAVTCQHVAATGGASVIRVNTRDGGSRLLEFEPQDWEFLPGADDLAATDVTDQLFPSKDEFSFVPDNLMASKEFMKSVEFGIGEDGFMLGLFADHPGKARNLVAARFGNVSLLANDDEPLEQPNGNVCPSHLFDMRSRPGFSGSPVFVYRTPGSDLRAAPLRGRNKPRGEFRGHAVIGGAVSGSLFYSPQEELEIANNTFIALFGIHAGQYYDRVTISRMKGAKAEGGEPIVEGDKLRVPNSVALVVPVWQITALLNQEIFVKQRREREERDAAKRDPMSVAQPESARADEGSEPSTKTDNPSHKEAFSSLVDAAAKKRPQAD